MEKLAEAYKKVNANTEIEIQQSDSSTGMNAVIDGVCDIGMSSRELKDSEKEKGLDPAVIAMDGIAVIVNKGNPVSNLTKDQVQKIFTGEITGWSGVK
jgi:phosphate transport system substrate-binding protein